MTARLTRMPASALSDAAHGGDIVQFPTSYPRTDSSGSTDQQSTWQLDTRSLALSTAGQAAIENHLKAAFLLLAHRYCGRAEMVIGCSTDTRRIAALSSRLDTETTFADLVRLVAEHRGDPAEPSSGTVAVRGADDVQDFGPPPPGIDLLLEIAAFGTVAELTLRYKGALFAPAFVERLAANLTTLASDAARRPNDRVSELVLLAEKERRSLLALGTGADLAYPRDCSLPALVAAQAERTPNAPAVWSRDEQLTYRELDDWANAIARVLVGLGLRRGDRVGVSAARTTGLVCLLLAIHKVGCAYVPLDPDYPADRLLAIADTADMSAVVFDAAAPAWAANLTTVTMGALLAAAAEESTATVEPMAGPEDAAHLIYTSGSTGLPKGVTIRHRNVAALLGWAWQTYEPDEVARVLFGTSLNFDLSVFELWCPLTMGGCVLVVDNVLALTEHDDLEPTLVNTVPSALTVLVRQGAIPDSVTVLNVAGEPLPKELVNQAFAGSAVRRLYNLYGPSEDTTYSTFRCFAGPVATAPTIGVPIPNTGAYLLDAHGRLVPRGAVGELHLSGDGLSSGYFNDPERTAAVFVDAPAELAEYGTLYRTGDLAQWTEDGELRFLGRRDNQVKVRGYRIELGDIEAVLREVDGLGDVAALAVRTDGDTRLVCFAAAGEDGPDEERVAAHLRSKLPYYMQPAKIVVEDRLPLLPNGKVDRAAVAAMPVDWAGGTGEATLDTAQTQVAKVWMDLLGITDVGPELNFFSIGGHSLLANLLAARLGERFGVTVRVSEVYEFRTLAEQTDLIRVKRATVAPILAEDDLPARFDAAETCLRESARGHGVPAAGAAVYVDGETHLIYHGLDDLAGDVPRDEESRQRVTCLTKVLIAYVALMLVDQGKLALDEPLESAHPDLCARRGGPVPITLRQLLTHSSGIDDSVETWVDTDFPDLAGYVESFAGYDQIAEPGEIFAYSACGTSIVARLIEKVLGTPWRRAVNRMLLRPLGIADIAETLHTGDHYGDAVATGYLWNEDNQAYNEYRPDPRTIANDAADSFSVCLTLREALTLAVFALDDGVTPDGQRLLSADLARQMRTPQVLIPGHHFMHSWGLGWLLFDEGVFGFNSNGSGQHNFVQIFVEQRLVLIMLANAYPTFGLYEDLLRSVTGRGWLRSTQESDIDVAACVGTYESDGYRLVVTPGETHLRYQYFERISADEWSDADDGELVLSGTGGFSSISPRNVLSGSISPIWSQPTPAPQFMRLGQRVVRKIA